MTRAERTDQHYFIQIPRRYDENPNIIDADKTNWKELVGWLGIIAFAAFLVTGYAIWGWELWHQ